ncbi:MAG: hypothetical protein HC893_12655 [Chloroflexaceae bacterium]|nr:hypothetical protein [Chloroflexaceae bacterium]
MRFQDEIADDPVLGFDSRGRSWHIISKSDPPFDSKFQRQHYRHLPGWGADQCRLPL